MDKRRTNYSDAVQKKKERIIAENKVKFEKEQALLIRWTSKFRGGLGIVLKIVCVLAAVL